MKTLTPETIALQAAAHVGPDRANMGGVYFTDSHVVATDGHCLAIRKAHPDDTLRGTYKLSGKSKRFLIPLSEIGSNENRLICDDGKVQARKVEGEFPDYMPVIPQPGERHQITLNLALLIRVAKAMELKGSEQIVTIAFRDDNSPIEITSMDSQTAGIVMPIRPDYVKVRTLRDIIS